MRILVTGGAGFIGGHLCARLTAAGHTVCVLDDLSTGGGGLDVSVLLRHDVRKPFPAGMFDAIYHLACPASPVHYQSDPVKTITTAFNGTLNALDFATSHDIPLVIASTSEVYGDPERHPQVESYWGNVNPIGPRACYDEGKRAAEALAFDFRRSFGTDVRVARIFNTYGPGMALDDGRVIPAWIKAALTGEDLVMHGDGMQTRSFCFVTDTVDGLIRLMERPENPGVPINIGNPRETTLVALASKILGLTDVTGAGMRYERRAVDDPVRRRPDISRATALLGWVPTVELEDGLQRTIEAMRDEIAA